MLNINFMKKNKNKSLILEEKKPIKEKVKQEILISKIPKEEIEVQLKELIKKEEPKIIKTKNLNKEKDSTFLNLFRQTRNTISKKNNEQQRKQRVNQILGYE
jgi:hypothetical protein